MASNVSGKRLKDLNPKEVGRLLGHITYENIAQKMLSGEHGVVTGELLENITDEILKNRFEITGIKGFVQRKLFIKNINELNTNGVPPHMLQAPGEGAPEKGDERPILKDLLSRSTKIVSASTPEMDIIAFPTKKVLVSQYRPTAYNSKLKKIIIMGETGTGKSTLLNSFVNYFAGVEMEDTFRFRLVLDEEARESDQSKSQTTDISGYLIENTKLNYAIQIWDTPGFGDTQGVERDEIIKEQINELLKKEDECHAICFVVKANVNRLTDIQKYIIDRVLLFFGKEAEENIFLLATFADGNRPEVIGALEKSNFPFSEDRWFAFNNADLFKTTSQRTLFTKIYWDSTYSKIEGFFRMLGHQTPFSLHTTKAVIEERGKIKMDIDAITIKIDQVLVLKNNAEENLRKLEAQKGQAERTKQFTKKVITHKKDPVATKDNTTFCTKCTHTCHDACIYSNKEDKKLCWAMTNGKCRICPGRCDWDWHRNDYYIYVDKIITDTQIVTDVKNQHDTAKTNISFFERTKKDIEEEKEKEQTRLDSLLEGVRSQFQHLKEIAILSYSLDMGSYFQTLAQTRKKEGQSEKALEYEKLAKQEKIKMNNEKLTSETVMEYAGSKIL